MKKLLLGIMCIVFVYTSANAKEGNNSRIQNLEAEVEAIKSQVNPVTASSASGVGVNEVITELCNLYDLTDNQPPLFCLNCGNGELEPLEECDDANTLSGDGCTNCGFEVCGNGRIDVGEECDDGNTIDEDACSSSCLTGYKRIFVSSNTYNGDLDGLAGADAKCNSLAEKAGLSGTYKAWLSDDNDSAVSRISHFDGKYALVDGTSVAEDWSVLTGGSLIHPINKDEYGHDTSGYVWTNSDDDGSLLSNISRYSCYSWYDGSNGYGYVGDTSLDNTRWTYNTYRPCSNELRLYCIEE